MGRRRERMVALSRLGCKAEPKKVALESGCLGCGEVVPDDRAFMSLALVEARRAGKAGEVPVGAVLVSATGEVLARGGNRRERDQDPLAHAELVVLRRASRKLRSWRLLGTTLYVTLEPCAMCAGALVQARVARLVFGAADPKAGYCGSLGDLVRDPRLNHRLEVTSGVEAEAAAGLLASFFERIRGLKRAEPMQDL